MLKAGDVARIDFKWPQDEAANRDDGTKTRACTVLAAHEHEGRIIGITVVAHHGILPGALPHPEDAPYAIKLSPRLQRQLGLMKLDTHGHPVPGQKDSWVMPHRANMVQVPQNPSVKRVNGKDGKSSWSSGQMPESLMLKIKEAQARAKANGDYTISLLSCDGGDDATHRPNAERANAVQAKARDIAARRGPQKTSVRSHKPNTPR